MSGNADQQQPDEHDAHEQGMRQGNQNWGGAVADDVPPGGGGSQAGIAAENGTQDAPRQDMHDTTDEDRIQGVVAQTKADVGDASPDRIADVLRQRFTEIGLDVGDDRVKALAAEISQR